MGLQRDYNWITMGLQLDHNWMHNEFCLGDKKNMQSFKEQALGIK